jgi:hypothetical protein
VKQTRRELLMTAAGGIALSVTASSLLLAPGSPDAAAMAPADRWSAGPGKARHRFDKRGTIDTARKRIAPS